MGIHCILIRTQLLF
uniref:Uncharacterized protein n=1 Tax=Anguilla anguilla TaxID=7936 RepID=A0A0E9TFH2_ANGAN